MSERSVSVAEAKARFSELVAAAEAGDDVVITKRGKPVVHLIALQAPAERLELSWLKERIGGMAESSLDSMEAIRGMRNAERY